MAHRRRRAGDVTKAETHLNAGTAHHADGPRLPAANHPKSLQNRKLTLGWAKTLLHYMHNYCTYTLTNPELVQQLMFTRR